MTHRRGHGPLSGQCCTRNLARQACDTSMHHQPGMLAQRFTACRLTEAMLAVSLQALASMWTTRPGVTRALIHHMHQRTTARHGPPPPELWPKVLVRACATQPPPHCTVICAACRSHERITDACSMMVPFAYHHSRKTSLRACSHVCHRALLFVAGLRLCSCQELSGAASLMIFVCL